MSPSISCLPSVSGAPAHGLRVAAYQAERRNLRVPRVSLAQRPPANSVRHAIKKHSIGCHVLSIAHSPLARAASLIASSCEAACARRLALQQPAQHATPETSSIEAFCWGLSRCRARGGSSASFCPNLIVIAIAMLGAKSLRRHR